MTGLVLAKLKKDKDLKKMNFFKNAFVVFECN